MSSGRGSASAIMENASHDLQENAPQNGSGRAYCTA
jgi:hypothetical protein